jgi:hypothetical protein
VAARGRVERLIKECGFRRLGDFSVDAYTGLRQADLASSSGPTCISTGSVPS